MRKYAKREDVKKAFFYRKFEDLDKLRYYTEASLEEYDVEKHGEEYVVVRTIQLSDIRFREFANALLIPELFKDSDGGYVEVDGKPVDKAVRVENKMTGEVILVRTEGYDYARYTALEVQ